MRIGMPFKPEVAPIRASALRGWLAVLGSVAVMLSAMWVVWRAWSWGLRRWFPEGPAWLTAPDFVWFAVAWLTPSVLLMLVLRRRLI